MVPKQTHDQQAGAAQHRPTFRSFWCLTNPASKLLVLLLLLSSVFWYIFSPCEKVGICHLQIQRPLGPLTSFPATALPKLSNLQQRQLPTTSSAQSHAGPWEGGAMHHKSQVQEHSLYTTSSPTQCGPSRPKADLLGLTDGSRALVELLLLALQDLFLVPAPLCEAAILRIQLHRGSQNVLSVCLFALLLLFKQFFNATALSLLHDT